MDTHNGNLQNATLEVPGQLAGLFSRQAETSVEYASDSLSESLRWKHQGRREYTDGQIAALTERVHVAIGLHQQTVDHVEGPLRVTRDRAALIDTLQGCLIEAAGEVAGQAEATRGADGRARTRARIRDVEAVLIMLDTLDAEDEAPYLRSVS